MSPRRPGRRPSAPSFRRRRRFRLPIGRTPRERLPRIAVRTRRRIPLAGLLLAMVIVAVGGGLVIQASGSAVCDMGFRPSMEDAATDRTVIGAVERTVVASNPLPWGASVAVTTRVWGNRRVDRWVVTGRRWADCTFAEARPTGTYLYDFEARGGITPTYLRWYPMNEALDPAASDELIDRFGSMREFEISGSDRVFAWLRAFPEALVLIPVAGLILWVRRNERHTPFD